MIVIFVQSKQGFKQKMERLVNGIKLWQSLLYEARTSKLAGFAKSQSVSWVNGSCGDIREGCLISYISGNPRRAMFNVA